MRTLRRLASLLALALAAALLGTASAAATPMGDPQVAALQVSLQQRGLYDGTIDGLDGPGTQGGLASFERSLGLRPDGRLDRRVARALGRQDRRPLGSRSLSLGDRGWDVAALQFLVAWHGFASGSFDGDFGERLDEAVRGFQAWAGLGADGVAGPATIAALQAPPTVGSLRLAWPVPTYVGDTFGPRGDRFHEGVDFPADRGTRVRAAASGVVEWAGWTDGGFGNLVIVSHGGGYRTYYAHMSSVAVEPGQAVRAGTVVGRVGSTGHSSGPHLHFELHLGDAALDPEPSLR